MGAFSVRILSLLAACFFMPAEAEVNPLQKVIQLLTDLQAKVIKEGEDAHKMYTEFSEWCEDRSRNLQYEVKTAEGEAEDLEAAIARATSTAAALSSEIEDTSASLSTNEADLKAANKIREAENSDFVAAEKELVDVVDTLERAIRVLEREMRKGGSAMVQLQKTTNVLQAIKTMIDASMIGSQDAATLTALVQSSQRDEDDSSLGAPDPAVYESHSGNIIDTLEDLLDKAKEQLHETRTRETASKHNFEMLKQSLEDEIKFATDDMSKAQKNLALQKEAKANAEGDLAMTKKSLADDKKTMGSLKHDCLSRAQDHEAETKSRGEELKALAEAKKALTEMTSGAGDITYSFRQASLLQLEQSGRSGVWTEVDLANFEAVRFVRNLARQQHSEALAQLARRMASAMRYGAAQGADPFAKVRALIAGMIESLEKDAHADASHKAYCDKEMGETLASKADKEAEIEKLSTSIDSMSAASQQLKEEVAALQKALADLASSQAELTKLRQAEKEAYNKNKPEMEAGLEGVKMALKVLREYYAKEGKAHTEAEGSSDGIIGLLEVVEGDFAKTLAEMSASEATSQAEYEQETRENEIEKATKEQSVKYKTRESERLDQSVSEATSDRNGVQAELSAILEYNKHLLQMCTAKPETYGERKARREAEIAGLKEALAILEGEAVLLQQHAGGHHGLRGGASLAVHRAL
mmetsp:Transcript_5117/g.12024  ORF Transcript_5117/g.12024 Transcript_5117/m.12024 type:complete len:699 (+) Transcript_5117:69-2165(+)